MNFSLTPFSVQDSPQIGISGTVNRGKNVLYVSYSIIGEVNEVFFPAPLDNPMRTDDLWQTTCFEFFLSTKGSPRYWEFNLSPSGAWNAYIMDGYRQVNMREETSIQQLHFSVQDDAKYFSLESELDLSPIIDEDCLLEVGISSVIQTNRKTESFWALIHPHTEADFHLRNSFILEVA